jgi:pyruvate/2-oxoglutarate dehydrogenase complex dihydrolipoamide dehydrogenase (E3) component
LFFGRHRLSALVIPWATFTCPEVAHVGVTTDEAVRQGAESITVPLSAVDRAVIDQEADGFFRIHHRRGRVVSATLVAPGAGDVIGTVASLMRRGGTLGDLSSDIFPYPTVADVLRKAGDAYQRTRLSPLVRGILHRYLAVVRWI